MTDIIVRIRARIEGGDHLRYEDIVHVPPGYTADDVANLFNVTVENVGWHALREHDRDTPLRDALVGNSAKLSRVEELVALLEADWAEDIPDDLLAKLREIALVSPREATDRWGRPLDEREGDDS